MEIDKAYEFARSSFDAYMLLAEAFLRVACYTSSYPLDVIESAQRYVLRTGVESLLSDPKDWGR